MFLGRSSGASLAAVSSLANAALVGAKMVLHQRKRGQGTAV